MGRTAGAGSSEVFDYVALAPILGLGSRVQHGAFFLGLASSA